MMGVQKSNILLSLNVLIIISIPIPLKSPIVMPNLFFFFHLFLIDSYNKRTPIPVAPFPLYPYSDFEYTQDKSR